MDTTGTSRQRLVIIDDDDQAVSRKTLSHRHSAKPSQPQSQIHRLHMGSSAAKPSRTAVQYSLAQRLLKLDRQCPSSTWMTPNPLPPPAVISTARSIIMPHIRDESKPPIALPDQPPSTRSVQRASEQVATRSRASFVAPYFPEAGSRKEQYWMSPLSGLHAVRRGSFIDPSDNDEISHYREDRLSDHQFELWLHQQTPSEQQRSEFISFRQLPSRRYSLDRYDHEGIMLYSNVCVELADGDFLRIDRLLQDHTTKEVLLSGWLFQRMRSMNGIAEKKLNEVCWIMHWTKKDSRNIKQQCLHEVNVSQVVKRRALKLTNQTYPALSFRDNLSLAESTEIAEHSRVLVCRWQHICAYADEKARKRNIHDGRALVRLREMGSDKNCGCSEEYLRQCWRGETAVGGSSSAVGPKERQQLERERRLAQDAAARMHRQANVSGSINTSNTRSTLADSRADAPFNLGSLNVCSQSAADPPFRNKFHQASRSGLEALSRLSSPADSDATLGRGRSPSLVILGQENEAQESRKKRRKISPHSPGNLSGRSAAKEASTQSGIIGKTHKRYTFGDGFCGCGGVSRGARTAGLRLKWAFDNEQDMCESYRLNFPEARTMCISAFDFAIKNNHDCKVDVLHLSPPCQPYSPAHTTRGQNDELNTASSFVISALLRKTKPRIVTLENTLGLEQRHHLYLNAVIQQFTSLGFSVRWKVIDLRSFGVPQTRRRLIMIAASPGEILPEFPKASHSNDPENTGLTPWKTINQSINLIPTGWENHDVASAQRTSYPPFNGNSVAKTMTCGGGVNNYHPSGKRGYTVREYASLQTFPLVHRFAAVSKTMQKKQIGNAVPPAFFRCLMDTVVQSLKKTDGISDNAVYADAIVDRVHPSRATVAKRPSVTVID